MDETDFPLIDPELLDGEVSGSLTKSDPVYGPALPRPPMNSANLNQSSRGPRDNGSFDGASAPQLSVNHSNLNASPQHQSVCTFFY